MPTWNSVLSHLHQKTSAIRRKRHLSFVRTWVQSLEKMLKRKTKFKARGYLTRPVNSKIQKSWRLERWTHMPSRTSKSPSRTKFQYRASLDELSKIFKVRKLFHRLKPLNKTIDEVIKYNSLVHFFIGCSSHKTKNLGRLCVFGRRRTNVMLRCRYLIVKHFLGHVELSFSGNYASLLHLNHTSFLNLQRF